MLNIKGNIYTLIKREKERMNELTNVAKEY